MSGRLGLLARGLWKCSSRLARNPFFFLRGSAFFGVEVPGIGRPTGRRRGTDPEPAKVTTRKRENDTETDRQVGERKRGFHLEHPPPKKGRDQEHMLDEGTSCVDTIPAETE